MEQDTSIDPQTGKMRSAYGANDGHQNDHYVRHTDPRETARDFSRPETIPPDEYRAVTGLEPPPVNTGKTAAELAAEAAAEQAAAEASSSGPAPTV